MAGMALLQIWDRSRGGEVVDLEITWDRGHDLDAKVRIPKRFAKVWKLAIMGFRRDHRDGSPVEPYPNLDIGVPIKLLTKSTTGIYAVARNIWSEIGWRIPPPFPEAEEQDPEVDQ